MEEEEENIEEKALLKYPELKCPKKFLYYISNLF